MLFVLFFALSGIFAQGALEEFVLNRTGVIPGEKESEESYFIWFDDLAEGGIIKSGVLQMGDSSLTLLPGLNGEDWSVPNGNFQGHEREGRVANAYKAGNRPKDCNDYQSLPESGTALIFDAAENGTLTVYFWSGSFLRATDFEDGKNVGIKESEVGAPFLSLKAEEGHQYVLSTTGKTNNCGYIAVSFIKDQPVEVKIDSWDVQSKSDLSSLDIYITDHNLLTQDAVIKNGDKSIALSKGHTYDISTSDGGFLATVGSGETSFVAGGSPIRVTITEVPDVSISGSFTGLDSSSVKGIKFVNILTGATTEGEVNGNAYKASVKPGEYKTVVDSDEVYTKDRVSAKENTENKNDVYLESLIKNRYVLPEELESEHTALKLNGITPNNATSVRGNQGSQVVVPVSGKQKVQAAGWYSGKWDINGKDEKSADSSSNANNPVISTYITDGNESEVTVNILGEGANYLYWITVDDIYPFMSQISVPGDFDTLKDALYAVRNMENRPEGEEGRVEIILNDDVMEQVVVDVPYVTLNGNGHELTWYYGQTYKYYSIDENGLYDESLFQDKYSKNEGSTSLWGGVLIVRGDNFILDNATVRNTFNYEVTDKEIEDGVEPINMPERVKGANVSDFNFKERSNAFYIDADNIEVKNSKILSSQDTFGRNGTQNYNYHVYVKDSTIGGNVDYICGEFTAVFDNVKLEWKTYTNSTGDNLKIGYIVAPKTSPYYFIDSEIVSDNPDISPIGYFGRTWGASSNASFINVETNAMINQDGWGEMNQGDFESAKFFESGNKSDGKDISITNKGKELDSDTLSILLGDEIITQVLGGWIPSSYEMKDKSDMPTLFIVGDSTACNYAPTSDASYYYKRVGFGTALSDYAKDVKVNNLALSGRSSKSFTLEGNYQVLLNTMKEGDALLIVFGHNDEKIEDATRGTLPGGTKESAGTFKNSLYENYIKPAEEKGVFVVLGTPIVRRPDNGVFSDSQLHRANGGDYAQDVRDLGNELGIPVLDLTAMTENLYKELGPENTRYLHAWSSSKPTSVDNTHLNSLGAKAVAYLIAEAAAANDLTKPYVKEGISRPNEKDIKVNPDYVEPSTNDPEDIVSALWTGLPEGWYGSVFGDVGGAGKIQAEADPTQLSIDSATGRPYFDISVGDNGTVHLRAGSTSDGTSAVTSVGKIASTSDGLAMYFRPVDAGMNFEISGDITVLQAAANNQVAFGAIVSDMVKIDTYVGEYYSYVAASPLRLARAADTDSSTGANSGYARIDGVLTYGPENILEKVNPGDKFSVSIKKVGNKFTTSVNGTEATFTLDMAGTVYAGFFVSRCAEINVDNIKFNNEVTE